MKKKYKQTICFDIDNTICKTLNSDYHKSKPITKAIKKINSLFDEGYFIIFFTSRFMGRNNENVNLSKKQGFNMTMKQLKKWKVRFHKLILGKPSYDMIVDDKSLFFNKKWYNNIENHLANFK
tara:strand:+ start:26 stop:394 length:369 start_codon:yes stop_codon:yes gene_type:complete